MTRGKCSLALPRSHGLHSTVARQRVVTLTPTRREHAYLFNDMPLAAPQNILTDELSPWLILYFRTLELVRA